MDIAQAIADLARLEDKLVVLFRPDVDALKGRRWQGNPVAKEG